MAQLAHVFTISCGVELLGESQVAVQIFGAQTLSDSVILDIANAALKSGPDTAVRRWSRPNIWRKEDANPLADNSIIVQYSEIKEKK